MTKPLPPYPVVGDKVWEIDADPDDNTDWRRIVAVIAVEPQVHEVMQSDPDYGIADNIIVLSREAVVLLEDYDPDDTVSIQWNGKNWEVM